MKFADYYRSKNPKVLAVDLNLGRKNRAVCALVGKDGTVHKVGHIGLTACNTTDVHHLLGLIARNVSGTVHNSHVNAAINIGMVWFVREKKRFEQRTA